MRIKGPDTSQSYEGKIMNDELQAVEMTIEQAEAKIALMEKADKLMSNDLFKELITDGYLGDDAVRLTLHLKPGGGNENERINAMLEAKATFSRFMAFIIADGENAIYALQEHKELANQLDAEAGA